MGLAENRRELLEKYVRGRLAQVAREEDRIRPRDPGSTVALSAGQQQMWLLSRLVPDQPVYNECVSIALPGPLQREVLARSLNALIQRHEAWRTIFPIANNVPVQQILPELEISLPLVDLRSLPEGEREAEALRVATEQARLLFDLARGPLVRALLVCLRDEEHRLFLTLHHILFDGVSLYQIFFPELCALYTALLAGQPSPLKPLTLHYADYAQWQNRQERREEWQRHLAYWRQQLAGSTTTLALPLDHPRPAIQSYRGLTHAFRLTRELTEALKALSLRAGVTLYTTLVAAFALLLARYSGQDDLLIGTAATVRPRPELEGLMGYFLNTLVLRADLSDHPTVGAFLVRMGEVISSAMSHGDVPFEYLVKELQPRRDPGVNPLFQVSITFVPSAPVQSTGWTLTQLEVTTGTAKFDLTLELDERPEGLTGRFEYNSDLFEVATIERLSQHWQTLLEGLSADLQRRVDEIPLVSQQERQLLLAAWQTPQPPVSEAHCIHQLFEEQVERTPGAQAVLYEGRSLTYRELNEQANQLAHYLRRLGVGPEVLVGLCLERSLDMVIGLLGILKAGGAYLPLDPALPGERLAFLLADADVSVILTQRSLHVNLPEAPTRVVYLESAWSDIARYPSTAPVTEVYASNLLYVLYTSGSTGRPKGVMITHQALCNHMCWMQERFPLDAEDSVLQKTPFSFDASVWEFYAPLLAGGRLVIARPEGHLDPAYLIETIQRYKITVLQMVPSLLHMLLCADGFASCHSLKRVFVGGEELPPSLQEAFFQQIKHADLVNLYGPTEATIDATYWLCDPTRSGRSVPIGRPIAHMRACVLDRHLRLVPAGVPGTLYLGGIGLARGYLKRPELTAERFIADPFAQDGKSRLYNTGDLVRYLPDGTLEFLGRVDQQIKLRGVRIEPGEIEAALLAQGEIEQAAVVVHEDTAGDRRLVAYLVARGGQETAQLSAQLRERLRQRLPRAMLPAAFIFLNRLPLNPSGKIDRRALSALALDEQSVPKSQSAPTLPIHHQLIQLWEEMLGVHNIGIRDDFFELGGHSLQAALLFHRVAQMYGKRLPLSLFFSEATIEHLASALLEDEKPTAQGRARVEVVPVQIGSGTRPFFYLHGDYVYGAFYSARLARLLGSQQSFYVLEPYQFDPHAPLPTFEEIAADYVRALRALQPQGPYTLGGWCAGGIMAHEMARQLRQAGQQVALLVLMDPAISTARDRALRALSTKCATFLRWPQERSLDLYLRIIHTPRYLRRASYRQVRNTGAQNRERPTSFGQLSGDPGWHLKPCFPARDVLRLDHELISEWLIAGHQPGHYSEKIVFFWTQEEPARRSAWEKMVRTEKAEIHIIPGTHTTARTDYLEVLAEHLRGCLRGAGESAHVQLRESE